MVSMNVVGLPPDLVVVADERRNIVVLRPTDGRWAELLARAVTEVFGGSAAMADYVMTVAAARGHRGGHRLAGATHRSRRALGRRRGARPHRGRQRGAVDRGQGRRRRPPHRRRVRARQHRCIAGYGADAGRLVRIEIRTRTSSLSRTARCWPASRILITVVDSQTADAVATELVRYAQRVALIASPCAAVWRTPAGIGIAGPRCAFGYDIDFVPVEVRNAVQA